MEIYSSDNKRTVNVGNSSNLFSLYSTIIVRLTDRQNEISEAVKFLKEGKCDYSNALNTARQFNIIRDAMSQIKPSEAVYDLKDLEKAPPWDNTLSPIVTSCANLYLTSDGKDLLFELVSILTYAHYTKTIIQIK